MSSAFYSVAEAAERLRLHERTILRFIHDGRLRATKVGKQYRILQSDLAALAGAAHAPTAADLARATCIVDVPEIDAEAARRLAAMLPNARLGAEAGGELMNIDIAYDPARRQLKVVLIGAPAETAGMLGLLALWLRQDP